MTIGALTAGVRELVWEPIERAIIDVTSYATTGGRIWIPGKLYESEVTATLYLDTSYTSGTNRHVFITHTTTISVGITMPISTHSASFAAWLYRVSLDTPIEDVVTATLTLKVTGIITCAWMV